MIIKPQYVWIFFRVCIDLVIWSVAILCAVYVATYIITILHAAFKSIKAQWKGDSDERKSISSADSTDFR